MAARFDTAWTYVYDGGVTRKAEAIPDLFRDVIVLPNGEVLCVGETTDSAYLKAGLVAKLAPNGTLQQKKLISLKEGFGAASVLKARSGDIFLGGYAFGDPELVVLDPQLEFKSKLWYFDTVNNRSRLQHAATLQSMAQAADGRIIAVGGSDFPYNNGFALNNYAVWMEFDSAGALKSRVREWVNRDPYEIAGWSLVESGSGFLMGGYRSVASITSEGDEDHMVKYTFSLKGVGTVTNNVSRVRKVRDGRLIAVGQAYEEDCWTKYQRLSFDGWWSFLSGTGSNDSWNTAGTSGDHDAVFDVAQLADNRFAFLGVKSTSPDSGFWVFVTDSSAKTVQWQKQFNLPGKDGILDRNNLLPYSIAATLDSGFIVVGEEVSKSQARNAFAAKLIPKSDPVNAVRPGGSHVRMRQSAGGSLVFESVRPGQVRLRVFDLRGDLILEEVKQAGPRSRVEFGLRPGIGGDRLVLWEMDSMEGHAAGKLLVKQPGN